MGNPERCMLSFFCCAAVFFCCSLFGYVCVFRSPFAMLCRWGSRPGRCNSGCFRYLMPLCGPIWRPDQPFQPSDHLFYKKNLAPLQAVKDKMKIIRTKGLEVCPKTPYLCTTPQGRDGYFERRSHEKRRV